MRITRRLAASPEEVWAALTEPESLRRWLSPHGVGALAAGAELELGLGADAPVGVRVRAADPCRLLELDWDTGGDPSAVRFELRADPGGGTVLVLDHERMDDPVGMRFMGLWAEALDRLQRELGR